MMACWSTIEREEVEALSVALSSLAALALVRSNGS